MQVFKKLGLPMKSICLITFLLGLASAYPVYATTYGGLNYGRGVYNVGETPTPSPTPSPTSAGTSTSTNSASNSSNNYIECFDEKPGERGAWIYAANSSNSSQVKLFFAAAQQPVNRYVLTYGLEPDKYLYGVSDMQINPSPQMQYIIKELLPNTTYYFRIRSDNGCATGPWSNVISAKTMGGLTINNISTASIFLRETDIDSKTTEVPSSKCEEYTVKKGDTLWKIANSLLGDGNRYVEIVNENKNQYPELTKTNSVKVGWNLKIKCAKNNEKEPVISEKKYQVSIKIVDSKQKPLEGVEIKLDDLASHATTNTEGIAQMSGVKSGQHVIHAIYQNKSTEESIFIPNKQAKDNIDFVITIAPTTVSTSYNLIALLGAIICVFIMLVIFLLKVKK